jgi:hypothetical protein
MRTKIDAVHHALLDSICHDAFLVVVIPEYAQMLGFVLGRNYVNTNQELQPGVTAHIAKPSNTKFVEE